jgi:RHS repeat-associated protein
MRWDSSSGQYDMGFRNYDPSLNQFASRDMYDGALDNAGLSTDPFTGSQYAFGNGNPVSNIEGRRNHPVFELSTGAADRWAFLRIR